MQTSHGSSSRAYLVERYVTGVTWADVVYAAARTEREAVALRSRGADLRWRSSWLIPSDEAVFCLFEAKSAEVIRVAHRRAGVAISRLVEVSVLSAPALIRPRSDGERRGSQRS
jgi:uncharacterized protein YbjT (DUF2867 family)